ncbi:MAG TPA: hypothetical protein VHZ24_22400 [Pirellulales bacterium]|nr:hypothetical protein [Pirellulales bacterium]
MTVDMWRDMYQTRRFTFRTKEHPPIGENYVVVTDHVSGRRLRSLEKLAEHRRGSVLRVGDLGLLADDPGMRDELANSLRSASPRFVAIAPRWPSYTENMLLSMWQILASFDDDPQLDAFPGLLLAPDEPEFEALVERSIHYKPPNRLRPFLIGQITSEPPPINGRSLQKVTMLRALFESRLLIAPSLLVSTFDAEPLRSRPSTISQEWMVSAAAPRQPVARLPEAARYRRFFYVKVSESVGGECYLVSKVT